MSHVLQYITSDRYSILLGRIGQLMVVIFFFYSGYGIIYSYDKKENYVKSFFRNRILKVWYHFAIAVAVYWIVNICLKIYYPPKVILLSFIGYESIGNSNWFVFDTLLLYFGTYLIFIMLNRTRNKKWLVILSFAESILAIWLLSYYKEPWWYNTLLAFPVGMLYYCLKENIDHLLSVNRYYTMSGVLLIVVFALSYLLRNRYTYNICASIFCLIICWFTFRYSVNNKALWWIGKKSFYIYIYMRVPMIVMKELKIITNNILFTVIAFIVTLLIAHIMGNLFEVLDRVIIRGGRHEFVAKNIREN